VKFFRFPYFAIATFPTPIETSVPYFIKISAKGSKFQIFFGKNGEAPKLVMEASDSTWSTGYAGVNVWQGSALFNDIIFK
jgi:fructan beta-fructosidase